jgi:hypothetical protein
MSLTNKEIKTYEQNLKERKQTKNQCCGSASFFADPDPTFYFDADPDPDADPQQ